jgi:O-antigen/teichoic acid export membrane protein
MEKHRGNLDDAVPPDPLGTRVAHFAIAEFVICALVALVWLAFEGGIVGAVIAASAAIVIGIAWKDLARRANNPIRRNAPVE